MRRPRDERGRMVATHWHGLRFNQRLGRWMICCRGGGQQYFYRAVMEAHLGRELRPGEVVHHRNGDATDDRLENLRLYEDQAAHMRAEHSEQAAAVGRAKTITAEDLVEALVAWHRSRGRWPRYTEINRANGLPGIITFYNRFGSMSEALRIARAAA